MWYISDGTFINSVCYWVKNIGKHGFDGDESANRQCSLLKCRWLSLVGQLVTLALKHLSAFIFLCVSFIWGAGSVVGLFSQVCGRSCVHVFLCTFMCLFSAIVKTPYNFVLPLLPVRRPTILLDVR